MFSVPVPMTVDSGPQDTSGASFSHGTPIVIALRRVTCRSSHLASNCIFAPERQESAQMLLPDGFPETRSRYLFPYLGDTISCFRAANKRACKTKD